MLIRIRGIAALSLCISFSAHAGLTCDDVLKALSKDLVDATCFASTDLTTNNALTTPANNSLPGLPTGAFTPRTDRDVISPDAPAHTPITQTVPGLQIQARIASDPLGQARFLLRLPQDWNGRLVVAGASGTRSEFNGDFAWSDYVIQKGYAYASQNKGVYNLRVVAVSPTPPAADPLACRVSPPPAPNSVVWVHFYDNDAGQEFSRWAQFMIQAGEIARRGVQGAYGNPPRYTYAVGTSNGGYQVRRAVELAPQTFDGGVDWEGTFVDEHAPNLLTDLPPAVLNFSDYAASGFSAGSTAAKNIMAAGYPPDMVNATGSFWGNYWASFWEVTHCQWQKRLDPGYDTYGSGVGNYNYVARLTVSPVDAQLASFATSGDIQRPLITVAGTMDALLPIDHHARAYARKVASAAKAQRTNGNGADDARTTYRLYEVQNGNHIENYKQPSPVPTVVRPFFPQLEFIQPHAQKAFDLLVDQVERNIALPPSQCIARGSAIAENPSQPGHCASLFVP